ncbi:MAG: cytochrome C [Deltaproteobacteria bacterium]|nr:cytochrome C [Deltaproteobacteria bacterium]
MKHTKHYWRAGFLLVGGLIGFIFVRHFLVPTSFGQFGFYRGTNLAEQQAKSVVHGGKESCSTCHEDVAKNHAAGSHAVVQCENCHAALSKHINKDGEFVELMPIDRSPQLCLRCHRSLPSRPTGFPQIETKEHLGLDEPELQAGACLACHNSHRPSLEKKKVKYENNG